MKITSILLLLCFTHYFISAQETKFVLKKKNDTTEEYYVLKNDKTVKHGSYVKYRKSIIGVQILESGNYSNGQKNGAWEYYHEILSPDFRNSIKEMGHYVNGKKNGVWTTFYPDTIQEIVSQEIYKKRNKTDSIKVNIEQQSVRYSTIGMYLNDKRIGEWTSFDLLGNPYQRFNFSQQKLMLEKSLKDSLEYNTKREALFVGGLPYLFASFTYLLQAEYRDAISKVIYKMKKDSTSVIVSFKIDTVGNVKELKITKSDSPKGFESKVLGLVSLTANNWIPAISDGEKIDSIYTLAFYLKRKMVSKYSWGYWYTVNYKALID